ncbi:hypothetical protein E2C01_060042 [Portunus trituberculatus]|uniref:Uncharacterized protein n=1 Tax=Portunus trituberculatus TaxID=210409 RepID=A0A5B7HAX5_PORTR|nr:hypothetical protein [Portunus trituberculatus]
MPLPCWLLACGAAGQGEAGQGEAGVCRVVLADVGDDTVSRAGRLKKASRHLWGAEVGGSRGWGVGGVDREAPSDYRARNAVTHRPESRHKQTSNEMKFADLFGMSKEMRKEIRVRPWEW